MKVLLNLVFLTSLATWLPSSEGAKILAVSPMPAPSHFFLGERLLKELAVRGHEVTMISYFPQKEKVKNYRDIALDFDEGQKKMAEIIGGKKMDFVKLGNLNLLQQALFTSLIGQTLTEESIRNVHVQKLLNDKNEKFDLIIFEMFQTEILYGLAHKYNCPVIVLSTIGSSVWTNHFVANPAPSSYNPDLLMTYSSHMSFFERLHTSVHNLIIESYRKFYYFPSLDSKMHQYFPDAPNLVQLMYNKTAMVLLNSYPAISEPRPHVPAMKEIGGFHVTEPKPLPKDLKEYMDNARNGVILFSMGSNLKSKDLSEKTRRAILNVFGKLKQNIIWKFEDENLPGKPDNVRIMKWCPQNDIFAHPNLKLFISHGGLLSTTEAVYHGIPVVGIPVFGDQKTNVAMIANKGFGMGINFQDLSEETLSKAINEVLSNPSYKANAKKASQILHDQPVKPLDSAVFWVNHVLKHKGADHFRTAAMDLSWYQLYSVDIIVFSLFVTWIVFKITMLLVKMILRVLCGSNRCGKDKKKKKD